MAAHRRPWRTLAAYAAPLVAYVAHASLLGQFLVDDGLISMAYARTFVETGVLSLQPGVEPVEAISNPSWTLLWAGLHALGLADSGWAIGGVPDYVIATRALGVLLFLGTLAAVAAFLRATVGACWRLGVATAGLVLAASTPHVVWSLAGLENPLYGLGIAALLAWIAGAARRDRLGSVRTAVVASLIAFGLAATRPDGLVYATVLPLTVLAVRWRRPLEVLRSGVAAVLAFAAVAIPALLLRWHTYGALLPNSAAAKRLDQSPKQLLLRLPEFAVMGGWVLPVAALAALVVLFRTWRGGPRWPDWVAVVIVLAEASAVYLLLPTDWMGEYRYATPVFVGAAMVVGAACAQLPGRLPVIVAALLAASLSLVMVPRTLAFAAHPPRQGCYVAVLEGRLYNSYAAALGLEYPVLMIPDVGGSALVGGFRIADLGALADKRVAEIRSRPDNWTPALVDYVVDEVQPDIIAAGPLWAPGFTENVKFMGAYVEFGVPDGYHFVRRDLVTDPARLVELRRIAAVSVPQIEAQWAAHPLASCGPWVVGETYPTP